MSTPSISEIARQNPEAVQRGQEQLQALLVRSATDMEFRAKLLSDPRAAIAEATGNALPENVSIAFVENHATATFVLPEPVDPAAELSDAELEAVAGGLTPTVAVALCFGGGIVGGAAVYAAVDYFT